MSSGDPIYALSVAVAISAAYVVLLRLIDLNEKEPLWGLAFVVVTGGIGGAVAASIVAPGFRVLETFGESITAELTKFVVIALALVVFEGVARLRGWSEIGGVVDGLVYGAAAGLGFAAGVAFARETSIPVSATDLAGQTGTLATLWATALSGLSEGIFGAIVGAGFGLAIARRSTLQRVFLPLMALGLAVLLHAAYIAFDRSSSLSGDGALVRHWIALSVPAALVLAAIVWGLRQERKAIVEELSGEARQGVVTEDELTSLRSPHLRRADYARRFAKGDLDGWLALRALQNRQVQLALAERRLRRESNADRRRHVENEARALRNSILALKERQRRHGAPVADGGRA
jgi:protease PrsW